MADVALKTVPTMFTNKWVVCKQIDTYKLKKNNEKPFVLIYNLIIQMYDLNTYIHLDIYLIKHLLTNFC